MAGKVLNIKVFSPLILYGGLTRRCHAICHYSYNLPLCFMQRETTTTKANAHLAHLQAQTHKLLLQLAKEPNFCQRSLRD